MVDVEKLNAEIDKLKLTIKEKMAKTQDIKKDRELRTLRKKLKRLQRRRRKVLFGGKKKVKEEKKEEKKEETK